MTSPTPASASASDAVLPGAPGAYTAVPVPTADRPGPWPGVVVVHDLFGLGDDMREQADWLAAAGYVVAVPDLFEGRRPLGCIRSAFRQLAAQATVAPEYVRDGIDRERHGHLFEAQPCGQSLDLTACVLVMGERLEHGVREAVLVGPCECQHLDELTVQGPHEHDTAIDLVAGLDRESRRLM